MDLQGEHRCYAAISGGGGRGTDAIAAHRASADPEPETAAGVVVGVRSGRNGRCYGGWAGAGGGLAAVAATARSSWNRCLVVAGETSAWQLQFAQLCLCFEAAGGYLKHLGPKFGVAQIFLHH